MQNSGQIARTGEEIITQEEAQREVERWWKLPHAGPGGEGVGARLRHWKRIHEVKTGSKGQEGVGGEDRGGRDVYYVEYSRTHTRKRRGQQ
jgi:hypothetical protein